MKENNRQVILGVRGLGKSYGPLQAVNDLSFDVYKGEIFGLLGPNGAGKTTTISIISGLLAKDTGQVTIDGHLVGNRDGKYKHRLGLCPQDIVIWESLTCLEQLEMMGRLYNLTADRARNRALSLLGTLGLLEKKNKLAKTLSGGMKRRLNIALALVHGPEILILDEPQAGLDPQSRVLVREYIRSLSEQITVILTTHDMDEADRLSDRVAIIDHGKLLVLDTPDNLKNRVGEGEILQIQVAENQVQRIESLLAQLPAALSQLGFQDNTLHLVGTNIAAVLPQLLETFRAQAVKIEDLIIRKKTLEDVFLTLTGRRLRE